MRRLIAGAALVVATALTVPAGAQPAPPDAGTAHAAGRVISGTIKGIDGKFVNAEISLVLRDSAGRFLRLDGSVASNPAEYADTRSMNSGAPLEGADSGNQDWRFTVPSNAHDFTFEVYPRGPGFPEVNWSHYGGVSKRRVTIPATGLSNVRLRLPLNCAQPGGTTGSIQVRNYVNRQLSGHLDNFLALSQNNPPSDIQGFRAGTTIPANDATPVFDGIAPDQLYSVNIYTPGAKLHSFYDVPVRSCRTTTLYSYTGSSTKPPRWSRVGANQAGAFFPIVGEFTGDLNDDIFWYAPNAGGDKLSISTGTGTTFRDVAMNVGPGYRPVAGDWNGDGIDDIFWYGPGSATDEIWQGGQDGAFTTVRASAGGTPSTWPVAGDFDGNGFGDILFADGGRLSTLRRYNASGYTNGSASLPANSQVRAGDVDGDFKDDLVWHNPTTGVVQVWFGRDGGTFTKVGETVGAHVDYRPVLADISGDFRADLIWYAPGTQPDRLWRGRADSSPYFAKESEDLGITASYQPFAGDFNGDGTDDVFWYAPGSAADVMWRMNLSGWIPQN